MAITRKPAPPSPAPSAAAVEAIIARGGSPAGATGVPAGRARFNVQMGADVLAAVERARRENPATTTRNAWILDTLVARLKAEGYL